MLLPLRELVVYSSQRTCLQEMLEKGHSVTQETFHYLLMGCWKDKESGFRMALQVSPHLGGNQFRSEAKTKCRSSTKFEKFIK